MPGHVEIDCETRVIAGGHVGIVNAYGVFDHPQQRTPQRRVQRVADVEKQRPELTASMCRRQLFVVVRSDHCDEVGGLLTLDVDDRQPLARLHFEGTSVSCVDGESLYWICHVIRSARFTARG